MKRLVYILLILNLHLVALSGNTDKEKSTSKVISGKVTDAYGESLPGAKIVINETGETFFADLDGNYKLSLKTDKEYSLSIATIGYQPLQLKSGALSSFSDLTLKSL